MINHQIKNLSNNERVGRNAFDVLSQNICNLSSNSNITREKMIVL